MPLLAGLFLSLFSGLASFFAAFVTKKIAFAAAAIASFAILTTAFYAAMLTLLAGLLSSFPEGGAAVQTMLWVALPDAVPLMVSVTLGADTAVALYRWNMENIRLAAYVT